MQVSIAAVQNVLYAHSFDANALFIGSPDEHFCASDSGINFPLDSQTSYNFWNSFSTPNVDSALSKLKNYGHLSGDIQLAVSQMIHGYFKTEHFARKSFTTNFVEFIDIFECELIVHVFQTCLQS
ncbi:hypothetical protein [Alkanindiges hydrocarboniclasticus]|uniref:hypothetical protein n=1 Tax=Alkanindiges hydrocarboniclasticus TaxID=1907941 RepID=UPI001177C17A|nr:hypothetical protein [Alkanindiges hydrocarboniclasticus]